MKTLSLDAFLNFSVSKENWPVHFVELVHKPLNEGFLLFIFII